MKLVITLYTKIIFNFNVIFNIKMFVSVSLFLMLQNQLIASCEIFGCIFLESKPRCALSNVLGECVFDYTI